MATIVADDILTINRAETGKLTALCGAGSEGSVVSITPGTKSLSGKISQQAEFS